MDQAYAWALMSNIPRDSSLVSLLHWARNQSHQSTDEDNTNDNKAEVVSKEPVAFLCTRSTLALALCNGPKAALFRPYVFNLMHVIYDKLEAGIVPSLH